MEDEKIEKEEKQGKQEKLPIDAKLLSDAVIELNISRRSVSLYPREHPIAKESIERAFGFLQKLFELRSSIVLGIAKDVLMIDEYVLDRKNPVFREFALNLHRKGLAAVTFYSGLTMDELFDFHEMIVSKEGPVGKSLMDAAAKKGLRHLRLTSLDLSKFSFTEGSAAKEERSEAELWENYIYGLLEGRLADSESEGIILNIPPEHVAFFMNEKMPDKVPEETYDRVITTYLKRRENSRMRPELFNRFLSFIDSLSPELKQQFLRRAFSRPSRDFDVENLIREITSDDIEKMMRIFREHSSLIPESLRNLVDKLKTAKGDSSFFDAMISGSQAFVDDIEIDENIISLFNDDKFKSFVTRDYQEELEKMLKSSPARNALFAREVEKECKGEILDRRLSELMIELLEADFIGKDDYLSLLTRLYEIANEFLETGRFYEIAEIHNAIYSHALVGRFRDESYGMLEYFFRSKAFIEKLIEGLKLWGRYDREGVLRLANAQKLYLIDPLLDALSTEEDPSVRRFFLQVLCRLGSNAIDEAARRLNDKRWYVVRNMIYLIREAGGKRYVKQIRQLAKEKDTRISLEAVKTLLHFNTPDAPSYIKFFLKSSDPAIRDEAARLAGNYKLKGALPDLIDILEKKDVFGSETYYKISAIKALGEIGDPKAVNALVRIYSSRTLLFRGALEEVKAEIFRNLANYPPESVTPLLDLGMKSRNDEIRSISVRLLGSRGEKK